MVRRFLAATVWFGLVGFGCGGASDDDGDTTASSGSGSGGLGDCNVYDGKDEYLACVCEDVKPCQGLPPGECTSVIRSALKFGQHDAGLDCVQAIGDYYECQFGLTCPQVQELNDYWTWCYESDPGGNDQPYCRRETRQVVETCNSFEFPCN